MILNFGAPTGMNDECALLESERVMPMFSSVIAFPKNPCHHLESTFTLDIINMRTVCKGCGEAVEAFHVLSILANQEHWRARRKNADTYARLTAEEQAERQAAKTRKAAYATLYRFGVTPEMYAEEYRRKLQLGELEMKQDSSRTLVFEDNKPKDTDGRPLENTDKREVLIGQLVEEESSHADDL